MYNNELYHHGIKGQKWGERNGPPYPLGTRIHDAVVAGAKKVKETRDKLKEDHKKKLLANLEKEQAKYEADLNDWKKNGAKSKFYQFMTGSNKMTKEGKESVEKAFKDREARLKYREKLIKGEKLTPEEEAMRKRDVAIKCALIGAGALFVAYQATTFKNTFTAFQIAAPKKSVAELLQASTINDVRKFALDNEDFVMKAGEHFYRQTPFADVDLSNPHMYVATNDIDKKLYRAFLGAGLNGHDKHFEATLKALKDIKAPSLKKSIDILADSLDNDDIFSLVSKVGNFDNMSTADSRKVWSMLSGEERETLLRKTYGILNVNAVMDDAASNAYLKKVTEAGYNALRDLNDQGSLTQTPLILLDAKNTIVQTGKKEIGFLDKQLATLTLPLSLGKKVKEAGESAFIKK